MNGIHRFADPLHPTDGSLRDNDSIVKPPRMRTSEGQKCTKMSAFMSQLTYFHFHLLGLFGIFWAVAGNADMIATGVSKRQHDRIGYFVSEDLK